MTRQVLIVVLALFAVAGCASSPPPPPSQSQAPATQSPQPLADCSGLALEQSIEALRGAGSYTYLSEGRDEVYENVNARPDIGPLDTPSARIQRPRRSTGSYLAPDRFTEEIELVYRDDVVEARRRIGNEAWIGFVGSLRWRPMDPETPEANSLLELLTSQPYNWSGPDSATAPGYCTYETSSTDRGVERSVGLSVDPDSRMPVEIFHVVNSLRAPEWGELAGWKLAYHVSTDEEVTIDPPIVDRSPITRDELLYMVRRRYCAEGPCTPQITFEAHEGAVDTFCYENNGEEAQIRFENQVSWEFSQSCDAT